MENNIDITEEINDAISYALTERPFHGHEVDTKREGANCRGDERWISGLTKKPTVTGQLIGIVYTGKIKNLEYTAGYHHKHFPGVFLNCTEERKNCSGHVEAEVRISIMGQNITKFNVVSIETSEKHDSTRMCLTSLKRAILAVIENLDKHSKKYGTKIGESLASKDQ